MVVRGLCLRARLPSCPLPRAPDRSGPCTMISTAAKKTLDEDQLNDVQECFDLFDIKRCGNIDYHEFKIAMRALGFKLTREEVIMVVRKYDRSGSGRVDYDTFLTIATEKILNRDPHSEILKTFELFDVDGTGKISVENLKRVAENLGEELKDEELRAMVEEFDRDLDGELSFAEFKYILSQAF